MKYCPYCGAELVIDAASFCAECGKTLSTDTEEKMSGKENVAKSRPAILKRRKKVKKSVRKKSPETKPIKISIVDDGYDGYYDDVLPNDRDKLKEGIDKEMIRRIAAVTGVMLLIIVLCVAGMYLL